jgi:hypothetical protein
MITFSTQYNRTIANAFHPRKMTPKSGTRFAAIRASDDEVNFDKSRIYRPGGQW